MGYHLSICKQQADHNVLYTLLAMTCLAQYTNAVCAGYRARADVLIKRTRVYAYAHKRAPAIECM